MRCRHPELQVEIRPCKFYQDIWLGIPGSSPHFRGPLGGGRSPWWACRRGHAQQATKSKDDSNSQSRKRSWVSFVAPHRLQGCPSRWWWFPVPARCLQQHGRWSFPDPDSTGSARLACKSGWCVKWLGIRHRPLHLDRHKVRWFQRCLLLLRIPGGSWGESRMRLSDLGRAWRVPWLCLNARDQGKNTHGGLWWVGVQRWCGFLWGSWWSRWGLCLLGGRR